MKNIIFGLASFFVCILLIMCIYTIQGKDTRKTETYEALSSALETAGEQLKEETYTSNEELKAAFIENVMAQIDSVSDVKISILEADYEKGIISAEAVETYTHPNGNEGTVSCKKTILWNKQEEPEESEKTVKTYQINFYYDTDMKEENLYKSYTLSEGETLKEPTAPKAEGTKVFAGWKDAVTVADADFTGSAAADQNYYAVWKEE